MGELMTLEKLHIHCVKNPFDPLRPGAVETRFKDYEGLPIRSFVKEFYPNLEDSGYEIAVSINKVLMKEDCLDLVPAPGSQIVFCAVPQGGGSGDKNPLVAVLQLAVIIIAAYVTAPLGGAGGSLVASGMSVAAANATAYAVGAMIMIVGNILIGAMFPPSTPDIGALSNTGSGNSSTYSWEARANSQKEGGVIPVIYGVTRVTPSVIGKFVEAVGDKQYLNLLYVLADHLIDSISSVRINETEAYYYSNIHVISDRLGSLTQETIPFFESVRSLNAVGAELTDPAVWTTRSTIGKNVEAFQISILCPRGLFRYNNDGSYTVLFLGIDVQYKKTSSVKSVTSITHVTTTATVTCNAHGFMDQQSVEIVGATDPIYNGTFIITKINANSFSYTLPSDPAADASGTITAAGWIALHEYVLQEGTIGTARWSCGFIKGGLAWSPSATDRWIEKVVGSTVESDHTEGELASFYISDGYYAYDVANNLQIIDSNTSFDIWSQTVIGFSSYWHWLSTSEKILQPTTIKSDYVNIAGKNSAEPVRFVFSIGNLEPDQYDIRVKLHSALPVGDKFICKTQWEYFEEVVHESFSYPGTALLAVRALATDQLSGGMPTIDCIVTRSTVPVWTGAAYENKDANNPAWACYDMLHNSVYGAGIPVARIDYTAFAAWATFCSDNSLEVNIYFDAIYSFRKALDMISILGRGIVVQLGSKFTCFIEKEEPISVMGFSVGNIKKDSFKVSYMSSEDRANAIEVTYYDKELDYARAMYPEYAPDFDTTTREVKSTQETLYGCTSRNQAAAHAKMRMNMNRYLTVTASWEASVEAIGCLPGDVVDVQHDVTQWGFGGRVISATAGGVTIDRPVDIEAGDYYVKIWHNDGTDETVLLTNSPDTGVTTLTVASWTKTPEQYEIYQFGKGTEYAKRMRVLSITKTQEMERKITALEYQAAVYPGAVTALPSPSPSAIEVAAELSVEEFWHTTGYPKLGLKCQGGLTEWHAYSYGNFVGDAKYEGAFNKGILTVSRPEYINSLRWYLLSVSSKKNGVVCTPSLLNASVTSTLTTFTVQISAALTSNVPDNGATLYLIQRDVLDLSVPRMTKCTLSGKTDCTTYWEYTATYVEGDEATYDPASATVPAFACELSVYAGECKFVYIEGKGYLPADVGTISATPFEDGVTFSWDKIADHDCKGYMVRVGTQWEEGTDYEVDDLVVPSTANDHLYKCTTAGTSHGSTEPTWPSGTGATVNDNGVVWTECAADWTWQFVNVSQFDASLTQREQAIQGWGNSIIHIQVKAIDFSNLTSLVIANGSGTCANVKPFSITVGPTTVLGTFLDLASAVSRLPSGGGRIVVKNGTYQATGVITIPDKHLEIEGESMEGVILKNNPGDDLFVLHNLTKTFTFHEFSIASQNVAAFSKMFSITDGTGYRPKITIKDILATLAGGGTGATGDYTIYGDPFYGRCHVEKCVSENGAAFIYLSDVLPDDILAELTAINNIISSVGAYGILMHGDVVLVESNSITNFNGIGIYSQAAGKSVKINKNTLACRTDGNASTNISGILATVDDIVITENKVSLVSSKNTHGLASGIVVDAGGNNINISNNKVDIALGATAYIFGVYCSTVLDSVIGKNIIKYDNNAAQPGSNYGIYLGGSDRNIVSGNNIDGVNNAATDIGIRLDATSDNNQGEGNITYRVGTSVSDAGTGNLINKSGGGTF